MENKQRRAIVIGAGIGGLAMAVRLAVKGYDVDVFEANPYPGGKLAEMRLGEFRFDAGPSLFTMPEYVEELFRIAGKDPTHYFRYEKLEEITRYFFEDGVRLTAASNPELFDREATIKTGSTPGVVAGHLRKSAYIYRQTAHLFLDRSLHKAGSYLNLKTLISFLNLPFLRIFTTMHRANQRAVRNPHLTQLFDRYATYNGSDPYQAPGILQIIPHLEFQRGAFFPEGGMYQITQSIHRLATELGVRFHFGQRADEIIHENKKVTGIRAAGQVHKAQVVVCNMDVAFAYEHLLPGFKAPARVKSLERSSSALIFYWGIQKCFPDLLLHNIFFSASYEREFRQIFRESALPDDPTIYVNISSKHCQSDAPEGMENWFVMINVPANRGQDWQAWKSLARQRIIGKLNRMLQCDMEALILNEEVLDPVLIEQRTSSYQGALYGTSSNSRMAAFFRHPNFNRKLRGLYFTGGSVHPGGGIPLALSSARIVDSLLPK